MGTSIFQVVSHILSALHLSTCLKVYFLCPHISSDAEEENELNYERYRTLVDIEATGGKFVIMN